MSVDLFAWLLERHSLQTLSCINALA